MVTHEFVTPFDKQDVALPHRTIKRPPEQIDELIGDETQRCHVGDGLVQGSHVSAEGQELTLEQHEIRPANKVGAAVDHALLVALDIDLYEVRIGDPPLRAQGVKPVGCREDLLDISADPQHA